MKKFLEKKIIWNVQWYQLFLWLLLTFIYASVYYIALLVEIMAVSPGESPIVIAGYLLILLFSRIFFTAIFWWIIFRVFRNRKMSFLFLVHIICAPVFVLATYTVEDRLFNWYIGYINPIVRLTANFYMPALYYLMQFTLIHAFNFWLQLKRQTEKEKELLTMAYRSELNALKAQIQPHFLFNTLNSISATVTKEQEDTRVMIAKLADTFRYALRSTQEDYVLLGDELAFIQVYLELERERFRERLQISIDAPNDVQQVRVPPMLLQPLVENAIKHGIGPSVLGGSVSVICRKTRNYVHITVADTGVGYEGNIDEILMGSGVGLKNTAMRLERLYNEVVSINRNHPSGLRLSFKIPDVP